MDVTGIKRAPAIAAGHSAAAEEPTRNLRRDLNFFLEAIMGVISYFLGSESRRSQLAVVMRDFKNIKRSRITQRPNHPHVRNRVRFDWEPMKSYVSHCGNVTI